MDVPDDLAADDDEWVQTIIGVFEDLVTLGLSKLIPRPNPQKTWPKKEVIRGNQAEKAERQT